MLVESLLTAMQDLHPESDRALAPGLEIQHLTDNSKEVREGSVFVAVKGGAFDGHSVVQEVAGKGCTLIVAQRGSYDEQTPLDCPVIRVDDTRAALAELAACWYGYPAEGMTMIGVTGTNGKTTCTWLVETMLVSAGYMPGVIGTVSYRYYQAGGVVVIQDAPLTTPDPLTLHATLRLMADAGVTHVVMEVSSHALEQKRLGSMLFDTAVFTNLSRDHLDYHQNLGAYFSAKKKLFQEHLKNGGKALIVDGAVSDDEDWGGMLSEALEKSVVLRFGLTSSADIRANNIVQDEKGTACRLITPNGEGDLFFGLTGAFNVLNMLATAGVGTVLGLSMEQICSGIAAIQSVPGRLERLAPSNQPQQEMPAVFVDYAHTPDALEKVLATLKELCPRRLICVFGCGGDRDRGKRPEMGRAAATFSDVVIVTSDNPRGEEPGGIIDDILPGVTATGIVKLKAEVFIKNRANAIGYLVEPDRSRAIRLALEGAQAEDWVLIAGKGHETYQIVKGTKHYFDDRVEALNSMVAWNVERIMEAVGGGLPAGSRSVSLGGISTDSRKIELGDVFVALSGEQFDGHDYVDKAIENGAGAVLVHRACEINDPTIPVIRVDNTLKALGDLAAYRRSALRDRHRLVGITGSSGKTTVKEMTAEIFSRHWPEKLPGQETILKTQGNFNNLIGLPLSLLPVDAAHKAAILEMGMNSLGEIERLTEIADPDIGCITNIQPAHLLGLGSIEGVAEAKGELFAGMRPEAVKIVNLDDPLIRKKAKQTGGRQIGFAVTPAGRKFKPEVRATRITSLGEKGSRFTLEIGEEKTRLTLGVPGMHNVADGTAAASIAHAAGIPLATIKSGLEAYRAYDKRLVVDTLPGGVRIVNDTYNANPASMAAALRTVGDFGVGCNRVAALGDMLELGDASAVKHREIGRLTAELNYTALAVTGEYAPEVAAGAIEGGMAGDRVHVFSSPGDIAVWTYHQITNGLLAADDWILVKGSRGMRMETMIEGLKKLLIP